MNLLDVMLALYASEINCGMESFWDDGFRVWLGNIASFDNCLSEKTFRPNEFAAAAEWLSNEAKKHFPESVYARDQAA